jgi:hypothetical protein
MLIATALGVFLIPGNFTFVEGPPGEGRAGEATRGAARAPTPVPGGQHA